MVKQSIIFILCVCLMWVSGVSAQESCALQPRLIAGAQGRVTPGDANNVRDLPARSGAKVGEIPGGEVFDVLEGPVCAEGLNWWRIQYGDVSGWTVEGQGTDYWVEPFDASVPTETPLPPTLVPSPTPTPAPARVFEPLRPVINVLESGVRARVINDNPDGTDFRLSVRAEPGLNGAVVTRVTTGDLVTILDGVEEADGLIWRELETPDGQRGWSAEGFWNAAAERYDRTLLPLCPATTDRIAFYIARYVYTSNRDGSDACIFDRMLLPEVHTFYSYFSYIPNKMFWLPDRSAFAYVDYPDKELRLQTLFLLNADGSERRQITNGSDVFWFDWSPDGERLTLAQTVSGAPQIWTMRVDGSVYGALTSGGGRKVWSGWLADSETVLYVENIGEGRNQIGPTPQEFIFYTVNVVSGGNTVLYRTNFDVVEATLSPDRSKLLIQAWEGEDIEGSDYLEYTIFQTIMIDLETREVSLLPENLPYGLFWRDDGSELIGFRDDRLYRVSLSGEDVTEVSLERSVSSIAYVFPIDWTTDGELIMLNGGRSFISTDDNELVAINVEDGTVTPLVAAIGE